VPGAIRRAASAGAAWAGLQLHITGEAPLEESIPAGIKGPVSPFLAGLLCRCPGCGKGALYKGFLSLHDRCQFCGLDFGFADSGDGPAVFIMLIAGFIVTGAALIVEMTYAPPYWVHAALWIPIGVGIPLLMLRPLKALLIALQYANKAAEGRPQ
jgi:uncharacterized protein (DUF983 family)